MKNIKSLSKTEVRTINGGLLNPSPSPSDELPIIPFGDPSDWDPYFYQLPV